jgi:hypothetical protein
MTASTTQTSSFHTPSLLRKALWLDVLSSGAMALVLLLAAAALASLLGLDTALLRSVGVSFMPFVAFVAWTASREAIPRIAAAWVVGLNAVWVVGCLAIALIGWLQPTTLGTVFIVAQALFVGVMAALQWLGLKRMGRQA